MRYFTLITRIPGCPWVPQFGSHLREDVEFEQEECSGEISRIIESEDDQRSIDLRIKEINAGLSLEVLEQEFITVT